MFGATMPPAQQRREGEASCSLLQVRLRSTLVLKLKSHRVSNFFRILFIQNTAK
jgi:hypothetical protein